MSRFINTFFEERVEQLFDLAELVERIFSSAGLDRLVRPDQPSVRRAVRLVFAGEKVRPEYPEIAPELGPFANCAASV
jgi:hypothetical protein